MGVVPSPIDLYEQSSMIKIYKANTNISVNVVLSNKKNMHIAFIPLSNGSSTYTTDNADIQGALERHYAYGKLFRLYKVEEERTGKPEGIESPVIAGLEDSASDGPEVAKKKVVYVSDFASAKDYLADTFGISRTMLRSQKGILEHAEARGIEFEGL